MTALWVTLLVLAALFGLTALAFRRGNPTTRAMESSERGDGRGGDQTGLTARNRFNGTGG
jgi:hypothetical protein